LLVLSADRVAQLQEVADQSRSGERNLRAHRGVLQPSTCPLELRLRQPRDYRISRPINSSPLETGENGGQTRVWGVSTCHLSVRQSLPLSPTRLSPWSRHHGWRPTNSVADWSASPGTSALDLCGRSPATSLIVPRSDRATLRFTGPDLATLKKAFDSSVQ